MPKFPVTLTTTEDKKRQLKLSNGRDIYFAKGKDKGVGKGGLYSTTKATADDPGERRIDAIAKFDTVPKNIAEFLGACISRAYNPQHAAEVAFAIPDGHTIPDENGDNVCVASIFAEKTQGDLYELLDIEVKFPGKDKANLNDAEKKQLLKHRPKMYKTLHQAELKHLVTMVKARDNRYAGLETIAVLSLLLKDDDVHTGNIVVTENGLVRIDCAWGFHEYEDSIGDPEIDSVAYNATKALSKQPTNHFSEYPEELKLRTQFAEELDKVAKCDFAPILEAAFETIGKYYGKSALIKFAEYIGMDTNNISTLEADKLLTEIREYLDQKMKNRQKDLARYSAQIKMELCLNKDTDVVWIIKDYEDSAEKSVAFKDVVMSNPEYFFEILNGSRKLEIKYKKDGDAKLKPEKVDGVIKKTIGEILSKDSLLSLVSKDRLLEEDLREAKILIGLGLLPDADTYGKTALHHAAEKGHTEIIKELIKKEVDINAHDSFGLTPLHYAVLKGDLDAILILLNNGANINAKSQLNQTALDIAIENSSPDIIAILLARGASILQSSSSRQTYAENNTISGLLLNKNKDLAEELIKILSDLKVKGNTELVNKFIESLPAGNGRVNKDAIRQQVFAPLQKEEPAKAAKSENPFSPEVSHKEGDKASYSKLMSFGGLGLIIALAGSGFAIAVLLGILTPIMPISIAYFAIPVIGVASQAIGLVGAAMCTKSLYDGYKVYQNNKSKSEGIMLGSISTQTTEHTPQPEHMPQPETEHTKKERENQHNKADTPDRNPHHHRHHSKHHSSPPKSRRHSDTVLYSKHTDGEPYLDLNPEALSGRPNDKHQHSRLKRSSTEIGRPS